MVKPLGTRFGSAIGASLLVNFLLVAVASLLVHERGLPQDITDPVGVKLVELAPPEPPEPEEIKEPPKPKPQAKLDFVPDLVRPELSAPSGMDMGIAINVGQFETSDMNDEFIFEAYDGIAVVETIDRMASIVKLHIAPGCEPDVDNVLNELKKEIRIEPVSETFAATK